MIVYKIKKSTQKDLLLHLQKCDALFVPALSLKVDLEDYAHKIFDRAETFEAWDNTALVGVIAAYFNDIKTQIGFITNVSVLREYNNQGIASQLMKMTQDYALQNGFQKICLEVHPKNENALQFYKNKEFKITAIKDDSITMEHTINPS